MFSGLLEDCGLWWEPTLVLGQGEGVILLCAGQGFVSVHFQSHLFVPCPKEFMLREALGLSWRGGMARLQ